MVDVRGLDPRFAPSSRLSAVRFSTFTAEDIARISCKRITNPNTFDSLLNPNLGGLYDPALGPSGKHDYCGTCGLNYVHCPGHMGHIPLPLPVYHPVFFNTMYQLVRASCFVCHRLLCTPVAANLVKGQLELVEVGLLSESLEIERMVATGEDGGTDGASVDGLVASIADYVDRCKRQAASDDSGQPFIRTKNLVEFKRKLVSDFIKSCMHVARCPHCTAPVRKVRQEQRVRVFLKSLSKKQATAWTAAIGKETSRKRLAEGVNTSERRRRTEELGTEGEGLVSEAAGKPTEQNYISPLEVRQHLRELWVSERTLLNAIFVNVPPRGGFGGEWQGGSPADMFFLGVVPVPPSRFRPIATMGERSFENPQTANLTKILADTIAIHELMAAREQEGAAEVPQAGRGRKGPSLSQRLQFSWVKLQVDVNCFIDSDSDKRKDSPNGIKQILEKKEGLFRKHMMGKRVDYAARSVISPDPYIDMDEIGIPMVFASRLTYPQPVTHWNVKELRQAVINGPAVHPGATHVQNEDGSLVLLSGRNPRQREAVAKRLLTPSKDPTLQGTGKKVFRHLKNGDVLLLNRQPTLHKPSIMAHKARVLPGEKTLRLHYANCKSYNADFDGDEMNAHFPQNELARAEGYNIVSTHHQYLVPKDGTPLSGLIQDHVVAGVLMTLRGRHFSRLDYMQLIFASVPNFTGFFKTLPPCMWKPELLWSGKQVLSTLLLNIIPEGQHKLNLTSSSKVASKEWGRGAARSAAQQKKPGKREEKSAFTDDIMTESEVVFRQGELLCGVLDKAQFGASKFGFVHCCHELYGGAVSNLLLSALGRLFTTFLQFRGFTLGVEDILVTFEADDERKQLIAEGRQSGPEAAAEAFGVEDPTDTELVKEKYEEAHRSKDVAGIKTLDFCIKKKTDHYNNVINAASVPAGLYKPFPHNCLQLMVQAGAKGSTVNCMQISSLLGQIELEGQRPPLMTSGRFLPSFLPYDTALRAGGFVDGRFLTGIRPQEYFFHCMAGREGLVDTAVKTSRSGYLQRCLIKHLEGICVGYDLTVRDCDGSVIQFLYGEDGLDITRTRFLNKKQFPFLIDNQEAVLFKLDPQSATDSLDSSKAIKYQRKLARWLHHHGHLSVKVCPKRTGFLDFYERHLPDMRQRFPGNKTYPNANYRTKAQLELLDMWYGTSPMERTSWNKPYSPCPDPVVSQMKPDTHFGAIPELLTSEIDAFCDSNPGDILGRDEACLLSHVKFRSLVMLKSLRALTDPGEAVGLLAAQSIGEPSTQMTLNTFHFAGRGEMNVTLGIPRLREILMTASPNIKTPAMDVPLLPNANAEIQGAELRKRFTRVTLSEVLERVEVRESLSREGHGHRYRLCKVKLSFLPEEFYCDDFIVTPSQILKYVETSFIKKLISAIKKEMKLISERRMKSIIIEAEKSAVHKKGSDGEDQPQETPPSEDEDEVALSDMEDGDFDASAASQLSKKQQHTSYDAPDESDEEAMNVPGLSEDEMSEEEEVTHKTRRGSMAEPPSDHEEGSDSGESAGDLSENSSAMDTERVRSVIQSNSAVVGYCYDPMEENWCHITLRLSSIDCKLMITSVVEKLAPKAVVWEVSHIKKGFLSQSTEPSDEGAWRLKTDGVNIQELWNYPDILNLQQVYTNNIHTMAHTYGIEAACKTIIKEISGVFKVYGIAVDPRHLSLIADFMTFEGSYKPFNRIGIEGNSSPFQKMSFETTVHFLKSATVLGDTDELRSPSACLVAGRVVHGGTGCFQLLQTLK